MFDALILMAGKGERTGLSYNKALHPVKGKPLFRYAVETFLACPDCRKVVLVTARDEMKQVRDLVGDLTGIEMTIGGAHRRDSARAGLALCSEKIVLIHDAARPLIEIGEITEVYRRTLESQAAVLAVKTTDTIISADSGYQTLDREYLWNVQTPQGVYLEAYRLALEQAVAEDYYPTDDISLVVKYLNIKPAIVTGKPENIKVTSKADLDYVEYLLGRK
jgi:2-C-methyl-D-erythritol 4-phosphate cytidylyltransferase